MKQSLTFNPEALFHIMCITKNFALDYNDYVLDYGDFQQDIGSRLSDYLHCLDHRGTFTLTYHPNFEIQLVLVCDERRRIKTEFCGKHLLFDVKDFLVSEKGMTFGEFAFFARVWNLRMIMSTWKFFWV